MKDHKNEDGPLQQIDRALMAPAEDFVGRIAEKTINAMLYFDDHIWPYIFCFGSIAGIVWFVWRTISNV